MNKIRLRSLSPPSGLLNRGKRCKVKEIKYRKTELKRSNFSKDEDELIIKLHALLGNRWSLIAGRLPGRTDDEVRIHWETYLKSQLMKMGIDTTNHRLLHRYISRRFHNYSSHKKHETNIIISDQSSSVSETCDSHSSTSMVQSHLPDLNIGLIPMMNETTSLPARCLEDSSSESSIYCSTGQETLLLFR